ncbi:hypothetical protein POM88_038740 [Heracleum sosnowskyi]|uniref:Cytochrome P450 n=1 Tax=Heracleum sosnowskyi TaxID=360622 RepID=A0AAD8HB84_9APIA|nr:hypothetical protein POM88_038740 [Heracleum sosnowskyi]
MPEQYSLYLCFFSFFSVTVFLYKWLTTAKTALKNLPPSPRKFPIIGNLHQIGPDPHISLGALAQKVALGKKYGNDKGNSYKYLIGELNKLLGYFSSIGEYIPLLYWVDCLRGLRGKVEKVADEVDAFLESVLGDHRLGESDNDDANKDFVSILLEIQKQNTDTGFSIDRDCIKAVILDMFDFELPHGENMEDLDMTSVTGLTVRRKSPLLVIATPHV